MKKTNRDNILVSVCCFTYNQENYISEAIEGFLNQKTSFNFEIIIHDDCSSDGTIDILKEYEKKYPDIIKVIYEEKNLYSQNIKIEPIVFKEAKGKYIAICEGDDYWCDENKLQLQFEFMEKNKDYSLLFHDVKLYMEDTKKYIVRDSGYVDDSDVAMENVILKTGIGGSFPTCSMFFKSEYCRNLPDFFLNAPVGDMPLTLYLGCKGKMYYMNKIMGVYRCNIPGSWSIRIKNRSKDEVIKSQKAFDDMMIDFNKYSNYVYDDEVKLYLLRNEFELNVYLQKFDIIKNKKYNQLYEIASKRDKIRYFLLRHFPGLFLFLKRLKNGK